MYEMWQFKRQKVQKIADVNVCMGVFFVRLGLK